MFISFDRNIDFHFLQYECIYLILSQQIKTNRKINILTRTPVSLFLSYNTELSKKVTVNVSFKRFDFFDNL